MKEAGRKKRNGEVCCKIRTTLRKQGIGYTLKVPFMRHSNFADRGFSVPQAWDTLPGDVRSTTYYMTSKKKLKTSTLSNGGFSVL